MSDTTHGTGDWMGRHVSRQVLASLASLVPRRPLVGEDRVYVRRVAECHANADGVAAGARRQSGIHTLWALRELERAEAEVARLRRMVAKGEAADDVRILEEFRRMVSEASAAERRGEQQG